MTDQPTREADLVPRPGAAVPERSSNPTQGSLQQFGQEFARLMAEVHHDLEQMREAAPGGPGVSPLIDPAAGEAAPQRRLAEIVSEEQAVARTRALLNELIDERFRRLTDLIQSKLARGPNPLQKLRGGPSRRKP